SLPEEVEVPRPRFEMASFFNFGNSASLHSDLDYFVKDKHKEQNLAFSAEADRATLLRRVSLDLVGLPPSPEQVASFEQDTRENAYELRVDSLLTSPRFGERWAS